MKQRRSSISKKTTTRSKTSRFSRWFLRILAGGGLCILILMVWGLIEDNVKSPIPNLTDSGPLPPPSVQMIEPSPSLSPPEKSSGPMGWQPDSPENHPIQQDTPFNPVMPTAGNSETARQLDEEGLKAAQAGNLTKALVLFEKAVKVDPQDARAWNNYGLALRKHGRSDQAIEAYQQAIKSDPHFALAYKNLGIVLEQSGDKSGAIKAYQQYCQSDPKASDLDIIKKSISRLSN
jgi:Tetratricopeptide repeat